MNKFIIKPAKNGEYYFILQADNNEIILRSSETYYSKSGAQKGIESTRINSQDDSRYVRQISGQQYYFILKAANHEKIGLSEMYDSKAAMETGIASVKANALTAPIEDLTK